MIKEEKKNYEESLKNYNDLQNTLDTSEREGFEKGFTKGIEELTPLLEKERKQKEEAKAREKEAIKMMIEIGIPLETIAAKLDISIEEINKIV